VAQPPDRDPQVKILADWLVNQRFGPSMTPQHRQLLDEQIPGWDETFRDAWERKAEEVVEFRLRHGELPPESSREPLVRSQARWLKDQRRGRGLTPKLEAFLDRVLPGWRNGFQPGVKPRQFQI
jgi:hypothetical protein